MLNSIFSLPPKNASIPGFLVLVLVFVFFGACASEDKSFLSEQSVQAQSNSNDKIKQTPKKFDFLDPSVDLCRFKLDDFGDKEGDKEIYELMMAGFPEDISIEDGIAIFNKMEKCYKTEQPPLQVKEFKDAISREVCEKYVRLNDINICYKRKRMLEEERILKGSFLESGIMATDKNVVNPEGIWLFMERDKHRRDLKGELVFPFLIKKHSNTPKNK